MTPVLAAATPSPEGVAASFFGHRQFDISRACGLAIGGGVAVIEETNTDPTIGQLPFVRLGKQKTLPLLG